MRDVDDSDITSASMAECRRRALTLWPGLDRARLSRARSGRAAARLVAEGTNEPPEVIVAMLGVACAVAPPARPPARSGLLSIRVAGGSPPSACATRARG